MILERDAYIPITTPYISLAPEEHKCFKQGLGFTWTPKVCKIMAFMAIIMGLGLLFYILFGVNPNIPNIALVL